jgi:hypothetical protein
MEILNRNTFSDDNVTIEKKKGDTLIYIGKACYSLIDLERVINFAKTKDLNESLNYRVKDFIK